MEHIKSQNEGLYTPEEKHETSDVNVKLIATFGVFLIVLAGVIHVGLFGFYKFLDSRYEGQQTPSNPMIQVVGSAPGVGQPENPAKETAETAQQAARRLVATFPEPRLQPDEYRDYVVFRKKMDEQLNSYSWTDKNAGKVRIPVSRAIELVAERGLPAVAPAPPNQPATGGSVERAAPSAKATEQKR
jgi:hypothetical protein